MSTLTSLNFLFQLKQQHYQEASVLLQKNPTLFSNMSAHFLKKTLHSLFLNPFLPSHFNDFGKHSLYLNKEYLIQSCFQHKLLSTLKHKTSYQLDSPFIKKIIFFGLNSRNPNEDDINFLQNFSLNVYGSLSLSEVQHLIYHLCDFFYLNTNPFFDKDFDSFRSQLVQDIWFYHKMSPIGDFHSFILEHLNFFTDNMVNDILQKLFYLPPDVSWIQNRTTPLSFNTYDLLFSKFKFPLMNLEPSLTPPFILDDIHHYFSRKLSQKIQLEISSSSIPLLSTSSRKI